MLSSENPSVNFNCYDNLLKKITLVIASLEDYIRHSTSDHEIIKVALTELKKILEAVEIKKMINPNKAEKQLRLIISEIKTSIQDHGNEETKNLCAKINAILQEEIIHASFVPPKEQMKLSDIRWVPINKICFRGDDRHPDVIFNDGFSPKPMRDDEVIINPVFASHTGVVQCTSRFAAALFFPMQTVTDTWVYIFKLEQGFNVHMHGNEALTDPTNHLIKMNIDCAYRMYVHEMITDQVPPEKIIAAVKIRRHLDQHDKYDFPQLCTNVGSYQITSFRMNHLCHVSEEEKALTLEFIKKEIIANKSDTHLPLSSSSYKYNFNFDMIKDTPEVAQRTVAKRKHFNVHQRALFTSIPRYDLATMAKCLKKGADINAINPQDGCAPLFTAIVMALREKNISKNDLRLITFLLDHDADVKIPNSLGQSIMSVIANHIILLERVDDINLLQLIKKLTHKAANLAEKITHDLSIHDVLREKFPHFDEVLSEPDDVNENINTSDQIKPMQEAKPFGCLFMSPEIMKKIAEGNKAVLKTLSIPEDSEEITDNVFLWEKMLSDISNYREEGVHPRDTFEKIITYISYMHRNESSKLLKLAEENEEVAMAILLTPYLLDGLGTHDIFFWAFGTKHEKVALHVLQTKTMLADCSKTTLVALGEAHVEAVKLILSDSNVCGRLNPDSIRKIENAHNNKRLSI